jgi:hypothetical protein
MVYFYSSVFTETNNAVKQFQLLLSLKAGAAQPHNSSREPFTCGDGGSWHWLYVISRNGTIEQRN